MTETDVWGQVEKRFATLSDHLRTRFTEVGVEADSELQALEQSVRGLMKVIEDAIGATDKAMRDRRLRSDVAELFASLRHALVTSLDRAQQQVRHPLGRVEHRTATSPASAAKRPGRATRSPGTTARGTGQRTRRAG
jgi:ElaB/YqjD/DUF883 family membrane-anchored ribosome-binding protein